MAAPLVDETQRSIAVVAEPERKMLMARRQSLIIDLGAIEDYLGLERSIVPRRKREPTRHEELRDKFDNVVTSQRN